MTALTEDVRREVPRLRPVAAFLRPLAERVDEAITHFRDRGFDMNAPRDRVAELAAREPAALERLRALGSYLTHNDYRSKNVFLSDRDQPVIFDWDSASYGPPGSTLRTMARQPDEALKEVVGLYCSHLESKGWSFRQEDVTFALRATNVFRALAFGSTISNRLNNSREKQLRWGLENLHYLVC